MIIGIASGISYLEFAAALTPIALLGMGIIWVVLVLFYPQEFSAAHFDHVEIPEPRLFRPLLYKSLFVTAGLLVAFVLGVPIAEAAFVAGCVLLFTRRCPEKVMNEVDWKPARLLCRPVHPHRRHRTERPDRQPVRLPRARCLNAARRRWRR